MTNEYLYSWYNTGLPTHIDALRNVAYLAIQHHSQWIDGAPDKPWSEEWFIAITEWGDRVVLIALPNEYSYDFKTADETYIKREKIRRWMPFPDSEYVDPRMPLPEPPK